MRSKPLFRLSRYTLTCMILVLALIFKDCTGPAAPLFFADLPEGRFQYRDGEGVSRGMVILVNNQPVLEDAGMFHDRDRLICINTIDHLDVIVEFNSHSPAGSMAISLVNATDSIRQLKNLVVLEFTPDPGTGIRQTTGGGLEITDTGNEGESWYILPPDENIWVLHWSIEKDTISLALETGLAPVVLLPDEKLELPPIWFE
jgi:hypothetical protein